MTDPADRIVAAIGAATARQERFVIAIAGAPAAGKSTLAEQLRERLAPRSATLGLDAFHYDNEILERRQQLDRKGAPFTFDVAGYGRALQLLRTDRSAAVTMPRFDRELELSRNCAELVLPSHDVLITEGNYLLLDEPEWAGLRPFFDLTVKIEVSAAVVRERILHRWSHFGYSPAEATRRAEHNDLPNAELVMARSAAADITVRSHG